MAEKTADQAEEKPKKKSPLLMIILLVVLLLLAAAAYFLFLSSHNKQEGEQKEDEAHPVAKKVPTPIYYNLDSLVVNVQGKEGSGVLQIGFDLQIRDAAFVPTIEAYKPRIVNSLIFLISSKSIEELRTPEGKTRLQAQIRQVVNETLLEAGLDAPIINAAFTSFIIQQ